jgi:hypothetical protein
MSSRTRVLVALGSITAGAVLVVAVTAFAGSGDDASGSEPAARRRTTEVARRDLVEQESFEGTLGYGDATTIAATVDSTASDDTSGAGGSTPGAGGDGGDGGSGGTNTLTSMAAEGATVDRGGELFRVDDEPIVLLVGSLPMYRELAAGSADGTDVAQLEENLAALGYDPGTVNDHYSSATAAAVAAWEDDLGRDEADGVVSPSEVVYRSGPVRIASIDAGVGEGVGSGTAVLSVTGTTRLVTVDLPVDRQDVVRAGDRVEVELPSGKRVPGVVFSIASVAATSGDDTSDPTAPAGDSDPTLAMVVVLDPGAEVGALDEAPVGVYVNRTLAQNALSVPVSALLALAEGGYGLELIDGAGATRIVAVEVGAFADGFVEVRGDGVRAGTKVVTA